MKLGRYLIGLLSGLTFGMLFAPKRGKALRQELLKNSEKSSHDVFMTIFSTFKEAGMDAASEMKKLSENGQLQSVLNVSKKKMREYLDDLEEKGSDIAAKAQEKMEEWSSVMDGVTDDIKDYAKKKKVPATKVIKSTLKKKALTKKGLLKKK